MEKTAKRKTADHVGRGREAGDYRQVAVKVACNRGNARVVAPLLSEAGG